MAIASASFPAIFSAIVSLISLILSLVTAISRCTIADRSGFLASLRTVASSSICAEDLAFSNGAR